MIYADYEFYKTEYFGVAISEADVPRLARHASSYIDYITMGRASGYSADDAVKMACCAIAEEYQLPEMAKGAARKALYAAPETADDTGATVGMGTVGKAVVGHTASTVSVSEPELQSQSVGSWSKTYRSGGESAQQALTAAQTAKAALASAANQYLAGTGLLYRGGACKCPCSPTL